MYKYRSVFLMYNIEPFLFLCDDLFKLFCEQGEMMNVLMDNSAVPH